MPLPTSRNTNYSPGATAVKAADLNDLQDAIIGSKRKPFVRSFWPKIIADGLLAAGFTKTSGPGFNPYIKSAANNSQAYIEIPCEEGDRITGLSIEAFGDGAVDCDHTVFYGVGMNAFGNIAIVTDTNRAAAWGNFVITPLTATVIGARGGLFLLSQSNAANYQIGLMHATFDRL